jgi:hypothetical protein
MAVDERRPLGWTIGATCRANRATEKIARQMAREIMSDPAFRARMRELVKTTLTAVSARERRPSSSSSAAAAPHAPTKSRHDSSTSRTDR